jgi:hypothetical protein
MKAASACQVVCRCRKVIKNFRDWEKHLRSRHPRWYQELKSDGTLSEDKAIFKEARERAGK